MSFSYDVCVFHMMYVFSITYYGERLCECVSIGYGEREFVSRTIRMIYGSMLLCIFVFCV